MVASAPRDQAAVNEASPKRVNGGKKRKAEQEALQPLNNFNSTNPSDQTTIKHDRALLQ